MKSLIEEYQKELYKVYIKELKWDISGNSSNFIIEDEKLTDDCFNDCVIKVLKLGDEFILGFRIVEEVSWKETNYSSHIMSKTL